MAAELVPIATNIGASSEIITNNVNGFLVEPTNIVDELIGKIGLLKANKSLQEKLIKEATKTIAEKFSYQGNLNILFDVYKNIVLKN